MKEMIVMNYKMHTNNYKLIERKFNVIPKLNRNLNFFIRTIPDNGHL